MIDKNGIYLSMDGDNAVRVIIESNSVMQLSFNKYKAWLDKTSEMKRLHLQEKTTKEKFIEAINRLK